jgi:hypothetical protein
MRHILQRLCQFRAWERSRPFPCSSSSQYPPGHADLEASGLGDDIKLLTLSMDLPFALKRWCGAADVERVMPATTFPGESGEMSAGPLGNS